MPGRIAVHGTIFSTAVEQYGLVTVPHHHTDQGGYFALSFCQQATSVTLTALSMLSSAGDKRQLMPKRILVFILAVLKKDIYNLHLFFLEFNFN